jgi:hypothetical protein
VGNVGKKSILHAPTAVSPILPISNSVAIVDVDCPWREEQKSLFLHNPRRSPLLKIIGMRIPAMGHQIANANA